MSKNFEVLQLLIQNGANPNLTGQNKQSPVMLASSLGLTQFVVYLKSFSKFKQKDKYKQSALMYAVLGLDLRCIISTLKLQIYVNASDNSQNSPLHLASSLG